MKKLLILLAVGVILVPSLVFSEESVVVTTIPHLINYQGMLTDNSGTPLSGSFDITFKIYNDASAGTKRWEETQPGVSVTNGLFNVILGSVTPIDLDFTENYWLDITVGIEHMPSRLKLVSVGFAYRAWKADTASYASSVSGGSHNHDATYVNVIGPDSIRTTGTDVTALRVKTYGSGDANGIEIHTQGNIADGIYINGAGDNGLEIQSTHGYGIFLDNIHNMGMRISDVDSHGIYMSDIQDDGIRMTYVGSKGIYMDNVGDDGIYINDAGSIGLYVKLADYGVYVDSTRSGYDGMYIGYTEDDGITISHADDEGLYIADAGSRGIWAHGNMGNRLDSEDKDYWGLVVHSYKDSANYKGLYVYGTTFSTGGWGTKLSGSSGDVPAFSVVSRDMEVIASGTGTMINGQAQVTFEKEFQEAISPEVPVRVVVTAQGAPSALLYVDNKSNQGFAVRSLEIPNLSLKTDNISFDWIAIARQKGYAQRPVVHMPSEEENKVEELKQQEEQYQNELYRQEKMEKQARREAERKERDKEEERGEGR